MSTDYELRRDGIINAATEQVRALLETHFARIVKTAEESFVGDEARSEPTAKATFAVEWSALASAPRIVVRVGYSRRFKDESETEIDPLQSKLGLDSGFPVGGKDRATMTVKLGAHGIETIIGEAKP